MQDRWKMWSHCNLALVERGGEKGDEDEDERGRLQIWQSPAGVWATKKRDANGRVDIE